ncbi:MAG: hypothetical protein VKO65_04540 [Cyanobacteriota bacterium]|nr:hypothetical protein [Cyanobacteriota bacterium]
MAPPSRSGRGFGADASGTVWEVGLVTLPAGLAQEQDSTVCPLIALVMEAGGAIRSSAVGPADQPLAVLEPAIANALRDPEAPCRPGPPRRVVVNRADLLEPLPPLLPEALISQGATPQLDLAVKLMRQQLAGGEDLPGTQALSTTSLATSARRRWHVSLRLPLPCISVVPGSAFPAMATASSSAAVLWRSRVGWDA